MKEIARAMKELAASCEGASSVPWCAAGFWRAGVPAALHGDYMAGNNNMCLCEMFLHLSLCHRPTPSTSKWLLFPVNASFVLHPDACKPRSGLMAPMSLLLLKSVCINLL